MSVRPMIALSNLQADNEEASDYNNWYMEYDVTTNESFEDNIQ